MSVTVGAVIVGVLLALVPANVWPLLLTRLGTPAGSAAEAVFLGVFVWWANGGGAPAALRERRRKAFRGMPRDGSAWLWTLIAAVSFAATVHAAIVFLFRLVPFPAEEFHRGYDFSFIPTRALQCLAIVMSAVSAGVCEEIGFRGYMQQPIEDRYGARPAIVVSSLMFTLLHLTKGWALVGMVPIVFGAGVLLGALARASASLVPGIIGHTIMDVGLFGFWWTGIAGTFTARPVRETGLDVWFALTLATLAASLLTVLFAIRRLRRR